MKKTILLIIAAILVMSLLTACASGLEAFEKDMSSVTEEWIAFMTEYGQDAANIEDVEDLNAFYNKKADEAEVFVEKYEDLVDRLDEIENDITGSEYTAYKSSLKTTIIGIKEFQQACRTSIVIE
ncbi:MAG: hypothetical protein AB1Z19_08235 [Eubacteriales bacterium]